jgi:chitinase
MSNNISQGKKAIYFFTNWSIYGRNFNISDIPDSVENIYYSFFDVEANGNILSRDTWSDTDKRFTDSGVLPYDTWANDNQGFYGNFGQLMKLKQKRNINVSLAIGGWSYSKFFSSAVSTVATRQTFVNSTLAILKKYNIFNGISLDWEYPSNNGQNYGLEGNESRPEDARNFLLLIQELRDTFNNNGMSHYNISICCVCDPDKVHFDIKSFVPYVDLFLLMTYDYHGFAGETICAHHTNPRKSSSSKFSCEQSADYYISQGVPSNKICIGGAFYSRGYTDSDGIGKSGKGLSSDMTWEAGVVDYGKLPLAGATEYIDPESKGAYSYDPIKRILNTYDNKDSIIEKCKIIHEKNLTGLIIWELSGDNKNSRSLVKIISENLNNTPIPTPLPSTTIPTPSHSTTITNQVNPIVPIESKILISPYFFTWAYNNPSQQKLTSLMQAKKECGLKAVTLAFIISGGDGIISGDVDYMISDVQSFIQTGGQVTISFGGQAGTYIENSTNELSIFNSIDALLQRTGVRSIDFDIEGSQLANNEMNIRRANVLLKLQNKYPNLIVRITLPVMPYSNEWNLGGIPDIAMNLLKITCGTGVKINYINLMTMDYSDSYSTRQGSELAISAVEATVKQLKTIPLFASKTNIYNFIGICPMIGINDDKNIFTLDDAKRIIDYANKVGVNLITYWALQRDRSGKGSVNDFSSSQNIDYEYYKIFTSSIPLPTIPLPITKPLPTTPLPITQPLPITKPLPTIPIFNWSKTGNYKVGNKVKYNNVIYECIVSHQVTDVLPTQALWKISL